MKNTENEFRTYLSVLSFLKWSIRDYTWDYKNFIKWMKCEEKPLFELPENPKYNKDKNSLVLFVSYYFLTLAAMVPWLMMFMFLIDYGNTSLLLVFTRSLKYCSIIYFTLIPLYNEGWGVVLYAIIGLVVALISATLTGVLGIFNPFVMEYDTGLSVFSMMCISFPLLVYYLYKLVCFLYININFNKLQKEYKKEFEKITRWNNNIKLENKQNRDRYERRRYELTEFPKIDQQLLSQLLGATDAFLLHNSERRMAYFIQAVFNYNYGIDPEIINDKTKNDNYYLDLSQDPTGCYACVDGYNKKHDLYFLDKNNRKVYIKYLFNDGVNHETKQEIVKMYIDYIKRTYPPLPHNYAYDSASYY